MPSIAVFPRNLNLPDGDCGLLQQAAAAVREEYRNSVRWKRLRCRQVDDLGDSLYRLHVGHSIQFDWTWEGSVAFRPISPAFVPDEATEDLESISAWMGDVVEVDETEGYLYVAVAEPYPEETQQAGKAKPQTGLFYVRPFEFLAQLQEIYNGDRLAPVRRLIPAGLNACRGNIHPTIQGPENSGLEILRPLWQHAWSILWGPPGTGKTYTIGSQVAECPADRDERVLVVSTTNRATDEAAFAIGRALQRDERLSSASQVLRVGKGADYDEFEKSGFRALLQEGESDLRHQLSRLQRQLDRAEGAEYKAKLRKTIKGLRKKIQDASLVAFLNPHLKAVVCTAFNAVKMLTQGEVINLLQEGQSPFTTVVIDEAGLVSRATVAALSCLAARRVVLVGDPRQLSPITKMSRVLPSEQATWLMSSALMHLQPTAQQPKGVHILNIQHRMHPEIRAAVSKYQYGGLLADASSVASRNWDAGACLAEQPRIIWYVLDEDTDDLPKIRAERGPGNRSWVRPYTADLLEKLFQDPSLTNSEGFFITPFAAQARAMKQFFSRNGFSGWRSSTVHSQQGTEADVVIFDTVNAGSYGWSYDEWQRLINVAVSRARECCILIASRSEMQEPYLAALQPHVAPRVFKGRGGRYFWTEVSAQAVYPVPQKIRDNPNLLGAQLERRKALRPVLSKEQQRLSRLPVDGKPRLVRGVAGSGKTVVLAHWVREILLRQSDARLLVLYGNAALRHLLDTLLPSAWRGDVTNQPFPWGRVDLIHVMSLLDRLLERFGLTVQSFSEPEDRYPYDRASQKFLELCPTDELEARWDAIFIDEAQDFGPNTLRLVSRLAKQSASDDPSKRAVMIFYDNAQNVYHKKPPTWSQLGIDVVGRSTVMEESFRSTRPITEFALNVLYRFIPPESDPDHKELVDRGLIEKTTRSGKDWWLVRFNHIDGPNPSVHLFTSIEAEATAIGERLVKWINQEGVSPSDIRILCMGNHVRRWLRRNVEPQLARIGVNLVMAQAAATMGGKVFEPDARTVVVTTANSFKGWDSEVLVLAGADDFTSNNSVFAHGLYTAMTRARSVLAVYGQRSAIGEGKRIMPAMEDCLDLLVEGDDKTFVSRVDDMNDIIGILGEKYRAWVEGIGKKCCLEQEAITSPEGEILLEPLFWFRAGNTKLICFGRELPSRRTSNRAEDLGFRVLTPGEPY